MPNLFGIAERSIFGKRQSTIKRGQKQVYLHFAERMRLRAAHHVRISDRDAEFIWYCRSGVSSAQPVMHKRSQCRVFDRSLFPVHKFDILRDMPPECYSANGKLTVEESEEAKADDPTKKVKSRMDFSPFLFGVRFRCDSNAGALLRLFAEDIEMGQQRIAAVQ